ncbi:hypothetical protein CKO28_05050 [Rhodovibrio sodomensis]|uniref:DUF1843 domain-containing protein n=1 Tax=Rhodovibrio sodomensis TaxID=1088 RepID=A0ABS1DAD3_9PROT|nr:hypothetical protein [Rhodovibrio sodomensis]MBK1667396.1 hypothetical protein [Rhodovibrio sodomensis]
MNKYGQEYSGPVTQGHTKADTAAVILDPVAYSSKLCEALQLLAQEFHEGRTPIADEAAEREKVNALLDDLARDPREN